MDCVVRSWLHGTISADLAETVMGHGGSARATFLGSFLGLTITSTPQGRFVYWKYFEPSELLGYESHLVAFMQELSFQEGRPLSPIMEEGESSTELIEYSLRANHPLD
jgi:hypothetical protein